MRTFLLALALVFVALGCGAPLSEIHGTVRHQGKPLASGTIILVASDNKTHPADIGKDGTYRVSGVARGPVRVSVIVEGARPKPRPDPKPGDELGNKEARAEDDSKMGRKPVAPLAPSPIAPKYSEAKSSGLRFTATDAVQEYSPDLP